MVRLNNYPRCSMYGIFTYICPKNHPNVSKYSRHGASGYSYWGLIINQRSHHVWGPHIVPKKIWAKWGGGILPSGYDSHNSPWKDPPCYGPFSMAMWNNQTVYTKWGLFNTYVKVWKKISSWVNYNNSLSSIYGIFTYKTGWFMLGTCW